MRKNYLSRFAAFAVCTFILCASVFLQPSHADAAQPNIILISTDDMGWGDFCGNNDPANPINVKLCGPNGPGTPKLKSLAESGVTLSNFYTPTPICSPSRAALMTGLDPKRPQIYSALGGVAGEKFLDQSFTTIARILHDVANYNTAIVGKWHLGWDQSGICANGCNSWDHGFEYNYVLPLGIGQQHKGFCLAKKDAGNINPTWYYVGDILDLANTLDYDHEQYIDPCNYPQKYTKVDGNIGCPESAKDICTAYAFNDNQDIKLYHWSKYVDKLNSTWSGFWKFSQAEDPTPCTKTPTTSCPPEPSDAYSLTRIFTDKARDYIHKIKTDVNTKLNPFFLYLAYPVPHAPLYLHLKQSQIISTPLCGSESGTSTCTPHRVHTECEKQAPQTLENRQKCEIEALFPYVISGIDYNVGQLLEYLKGPNADPLKLDDSYKNVLLGENIANDTIVIFTSDNGPYGGDAAQYPDYGRTGGLRGSKKFTYEGGIRVPFIASWPGKWPAPGKPKISSQFADMMDVYPTLVKEVFSNKYPSQTCTICRTKAGTSDFDYDPVSGRCNDCEAVCDYCIVAGKDANSPTLIKYNSQKSYVAGKDVSSVLGNGTSQNKNIQISWFGNYPICIKNAAGACITTEDSHPYAIRSNDPAVILLNDQQKTPVALNNFKILFSKDASSDVSGVQELYNILDNPMEKEGYGGDLCIIQPGSVKSLCKKYCLILDDAVNGGKKLDCPADWVYKPVLENLWKRAYDYHKELPKP